MENIANKVIYTTFDDLYDINLTFFEKTGLVINYKGCDYEFIIHLVDFDDILLVLGSSYLNKEEIVKFRNKPIFARHSWFKDISHSVIYYNDPTLYDFNELGGGWGIGTPKNWHLENISHIIKKLANLIYDYAHLQIPKYSNIFFYGSSMGAYMSIVLSILVNNSTSIADLPQFNLLTWWYWDPIRSNCFKNFSDEKIKEYSHRLNLIDLMRKTKTIPNSYIILDCTVQDDWDTQYKQFLNDLNSLPYYHNTQNNSINLKFVGRGIGHRALTKYESINLIDNIIKIQNEKIKFNQTKSEMLREFKKHLDKLYFYYNNGNINLNQIKTEIYNYYDKWKTCRIDFKNFGSENNTLEILEKNTDAQIDFPSWLKNEEGTGCVVTSNKNLKLKYRVINEGNITLKLRGPDYHFLTPEKIPIFTCYKNIKINNQVIFSRDLLLWHNLTKTFMKKCENNEILTIEIEFDTLDKYFPKLEELIKKINENELNFQEQYSNLIKYVNTIIKENNPNYFNLNNIRF